MNENVFNRHRIKEIITVFSYVKCDILGGRICSATIIVLMNARGRSNALKNYVYGLDLFGQCARLASSSVRTASVLRRDGDVMGMRIVKGRMTKLAAHVSYQYTTKCDKTVKRTRCDKKLFVKCQILKLRQETCSVGSDMQQAFQL